MRVKPAQSTLNELRDGQVMNELAEAIHKAVHATQEFRKPATVTLTIQFKPLGTAGVSDALEATAEVESKLPKPPLPSTIFFEDADGNPSRIRDRQPDLNLSIAPAISSAPAA